MPRREPDTMIVAKYLSKGDLRLDLGCPVTFKADRDRPCILTNAERKFYAHVKTKPHPTQPEWNILTYVC